MKFSRKIAPDTKPKQNFIIKKRVKVSIFSNMKN